LEQFGTRAGFSNGFYIGKTEFEKNHTVSEINRVLQKYDISTSERIAFFMGNVAQETSFGRLALERFDYSPAEDYFNDKYGKVDNTLGNIPGTNDGELFRGAGYLHLTGRENYKGFSVAMNDPTILIQGYRLVGGVYNKPISEMVPGESGHIDVGKYAWESAGWFWRNGYGIDRNPLADRLDAGAITSSIYGNSTDADAHHYERLLYAKDMYLILTGRVLDI